jgi:hypothetical protein
MKHLWLMIGFLLIGVVPIFSQNDNSYRDISDYYFPRNSFSDRDVLEAMIQTWYGEHLDILDNENLVLVNNVNVIRFTCLRTFHRPFSIKIMWTNNNAKLFFSMSDGAGGYDSGQLINHFEKEVNNNQINSLIRLINSSNVFNQSTTIADDANGRDGSQWIIEVNISGNYKVIDRWSPRRGVAYDIGTYLIELSGEMINNLY